jgi:hypothetical protein
MNKNQLAELIQNRLGGGSVTADVKEKYRAEVIQYWIGIAFDDMIVRIFQNSINSSVSDLDLYTKCWQIIPILSATDNVGKKYITIPTVGFLQIPNNKAIRQILTIEPVTNPITASRPCIYRELGGDQVFNILEVNTYLANPRYNVIGKNIYFDTNIGSATGVTAYIISPYRDFSYTEDLPAPLENNDTILEYVYEKMMNMKPEDKITDDNLVQI